jgi:hypothetical protein
MFKGMFKSRMSQVKFSLQHLSLSKSLPANFLKNWESAAMVVECLFIGSDRLEQREITSGNHDDLAYSGSRVLSLALQSNRRSGGYRRKIALPK